MTMQPASGSGKARTALLRELKQYFRRHQSQPLERVVKDINPILRGWVNYFAIGHSSKAFRYVRRWVENKVGRHLMRARGLKGRGWTRWSKEWLCEKVRSVRRLNRIQRYEPLMKASPAG